MKLLQYFFLLYSMKEWFVSLPLIGTSFSAKQGLAGTLPLPNGDGEIVTQRCPTNHREGLVYVSLSATTTVVPNLNSHASSSPVKCLLNNASLFNMQWLLLLCELLSIYVDY